MPQHKTVSACPICGKPIDDKVKPFCSARCADIDLGRWLKESYRIETPEPAENKDDIDRVE